MNLQISPLDHELNRHELNRTYSYIDKRCDYIPLISTITNIVEIIFKVSRAPFCAKENHFASYMAEKSYLECIVGLTPIIGNVILLFFRRDIVDFERVLQVVKNDIADNPGLYWIGLDYIAVFSTITNVVTIIFKLIVIRKIEKRDFSQSKSITWQMNEKSYLECIVGLIPILGNVLLLFFGRNIHDFERRLIDFPGRFWDKLDYVPILSTISNIVTIFFKLIVIRNIEKRDFSQWESIPWHMSEKSYLECLVGLIPIIGNVILLFFGRDISCFERHLIDFPGQFWDDLDYVPILSTISNIVTIFFKLVVIRKIEKRDFSLSDSITWHMSEKSYLKCIVGLIPILGNIIIVIIYFERELAVFVQKLTESNFFENCNYMPVVSTIINSIKIIYFALMPFLAAAQIINIEDQKNNTLGVDLLYCFVGLIPLLGNCFFILQYVIQNYIIGEKPFPWKNVDKTCDYIPIISTINNLIDFIILYFAFFLQKDQKTNEQQDSYNRYLNEKGFLRCFLLIIPIIGNIIYVISDIIDSIYLKRINSDGMYLEKLSDYYKKNKKAVLMAVRQNGLALQFAGYDLRYDDEIIEAAVGNEAMAIMYAQDSYKENKMGDIGKRIIKKVLVKNPQLFDFFPSYINNENFLIELLQYVDCFLKSGFNDKELKLAEEITFKVLKKDFRLWYYVKGRIKEDFPFILSSIQAIPDLISILSHENYDRHGYWDWYGTKPISSLEKLVKSNVSIDSEIWKLIIQESPLLFQFAALKIKDDKKLVLSALNSCPSNYIHVNRFLQIDEEVIKKTILSSKNNHNYSCLENICKSTNNKQLILLMIANTEKNEIPKILNNISKENLNDEEIAYKVLEYDPLNLKYLGDEIKNNKEIVLSALRCNSEAIQYVSQHLLMDPDIKKYSSSCIIL